MAAEAERQRQEETVYAAAETIFTTRRELKTRLERDGRLGEWARATVRLGGEAEVHRREQDGMRHNQQRPH